MSINSRIRERRESLNMSRAELAEKIGVTASAVANYENEISSPKIEVMYRIFDALKCDANYLYQDEIGSNYPMKVSYDEYEHIKKYRSLDPFGQETVSYILDRELSRTNQVKDAGERYAPPRRIIQYYQRLASAGTGQVVFEELPINRIEIPDVPEYKRVSYSIGVNGNSMEPLYYDGDMLLVEPTCHIEVGEIGIFIVGNEAFVKKLGETELISLNKDCPNIPLCIGYENQTAPLLGRTTK